MTTGDYGGNEPSLSVPSLTRPAEFFFGYLLWIVSGDRLEDLYFLGLVNCPMKVGYLKNPRLEPRGFPRNLFLDNFYMHL